MQGQAISHHVGPKVAWAAAFQLAGVALWAALSAFRPLASRCGVPFHFPSKPETRGAAFASRLRRKVPASLAELEPCRGSEKSRVSWCDREGLSEFPGVGTDPGIPYMDGFLGVVPILILYRAPAS